MTNKKAILFILLIVHSFFSYSQMTIDTVKHTVCHGKDITLQAAPGEFYKWSDGSSASSLLVTTTIDKKVEVEYFEKQTNLVQNGNFDQGNSLFTSGYNLYDNNGILWENMYAITPNAKLVHYAFNGFGKTDITKSGTDNFMAVNGSGDPNSVIWKQTISIEPNTLYAFSCLTTNLYGSSPAKLQFSIDNAQLGNVFSTNLVSDWDQFYQTWQSTNQTSITIRILNQNTSSGGNDFGLDDIKFFKIKQHKEVHKISVFKPTVDLGTPPSFCTSGTLDAGVGFDKYEWSTGEATQTIQAATEANYSVKVTKDGCDASSSVYVTINPLPTVGAISDASIICQGDSRILSIANSKTTSTYTWKVSGSGAIPITGTGQTLSITAGTGIIAVEVLEKDANDCISASPSTASISVDLKPTAATTSNIVACTNATVKTTGNQPVVGQGKWVVDALNTTTGYSIDDLTDFNSNVTKANVASYGDKLTATWEISNGVCTASKNTMVIHFQEPPIRNFILEADNTQICEGNDVVLTATIDSRQVGDSPVYKLFDGLGNLVPITPVLKDTTKATFTLPSVTSNLSGYYVERTSNSIPCVASSLIKTAPKTVIVDKKPTAATTSNIVACTNATVKTTGNQPVVGQGKWVVDALNTTTGYSIDDLTDFNSNITKANVASYGDKLTATWEISNGVCPASKKTMVINFQEPPIRNFILEADNTQICEGNDVVLTATIGGSQIGDSPVYKLFDGLGNLVPFTPVLKDTTKAIFTLLNVTSNLNGYYVERTSNSIACTASSFIKTAPKTILVDKKPTKANIIEDKLIVCTDEKEVNFDLVNTGTATWSVKNGDQGSILSTSTTTSKTSGLTIGKGSTFYLATSNGICPATKDSVLITRTGNPTTPTVKSQSDSICETESAPKLIGTPINPLSIATETAIWTSLGSAQIDNSTGQIKNIVLGENKFVYTISNGICQPDLTDTVTITVIKAPVATIQLPIVVNSTDIPSTKSISNLKPSIWMSAKQTAGYSGKWTVTNGATAIGLKGGNASVLADSLLLKNFNDKTTATWTVTDLGNKCNGASASLEVIRKNYTTAYAGKDTSICISSLPFNWDGNDFNATDESATWTLVSSSVSGASVSQIGTSKSAIFNASSDGVYEFEYKIVNTNLGITTKDTIKVTVDAKPVAPTLTETSPVKTCLNKLTLPAKPAEPISTAFGTWKFDITQGKTTQTINNPTNANSLLENIPSSSVTKLFWVVQNGVCTKDSVPLIINQIGTISTATISLNGTEIKGPDTTLCLSTINTLSGSLPSTLKAEQGSWLNAGTNVSIPEGNSTTQPLTLHATGESQISYTIKNNDPNCTESVKTVKIIVNDIPVLDQISGAANLCEGTSDVYSVSLKAGSIVNPSSPYTWSTLSSATGFSTLISSGNNNSATFSFGSTSITGSSDTASIKVMAQNGCGNSVPLTRKIAINLKPREFLGDILGKDKVCESATGNENFTITSQANVTSYLWTLDNTPISGTQPMLSASIPIADLVAQKPIAHLKVTLANACGIGVAKPKSIDITPAILVDAQITGLDKVCLPTDNIVYQGSSTNAGTNPNYAFEIIHSDNSIGKTQSSTTSNFATQIGDLKEGDKIKLTISGDASTGCFSGDGKDELLIDGYEFPDGTITVSKDSICEGDATISLSINQTKNDNGDIKWYFVKNNSDSLLTNRNGLNSFNVSKPNESGTYKVTIQGSVCNHISKDEQIIKIYERPHILVTQDPMEVIYQDGIVVPMPVSIAGLKKDSLSKIEWTPDIWLSSANKTDAKFVPKREKKEIDYTLTISTGNGSVKCETQANVKVNNTLPLVIPNAFSPNGDGVNDTWEIQGLTKYKNVTITVYNRWGNIVFNSKGDYTAWDGNINGISVATGTYYAILELKESPDNSDQTVTRALTIVR